MVRAFLETLVAAVLFVGALMLLVLGLAAAADFLGQQFWR